MESTTRSTGFKINFISENQSFFKCFLSFRYLNDDETVSQNTLVGLNIRQL